MGSRLRKRATDLTVQERFVLQAVVMGVGVSDAAREAGMSSAAAYRLQKTGGGLEYVRTLRERVTGGGESVLVEFGAGLRTLGEVLLGKVRKMVEDDWDSLPAHLRLQLFRDVMDRTGYGKESRVEHRVGLFTDDDARRLKYVRNDALESPERLLVASERESARDEEGYIEGYAEMGLSEDEARDVLVESLS